jgi:hypothetical protein
MKRNILTKVYNKDVLYDMFLNTIIVTRYVYKNTYFIVSYVYT